MGTSCSTLYMYMLYLHMLYMYHTHVLCGGELKENFFASSCTLPGVGGQAPGLLGLKISTITISLLRVGGGGELNHLYSMLELSWPRLRNRGMHTFWLKTCLYRCMEKPSLWICRCILYMAGCGTARGIQQ